MDIETLQAYVTLIKDILTGLAALTAAIVAIWGFRTWKKQLHWKTQYDLAQRLVRATYKVRDAIAWVRNPLQITAEIDQAIQEANIEGDRTKDRKVNARIQEAVYKKRWQNVLEADTELDSVLLEAEAIWGTSVKEKFEPLANCMGNLSMAIGYYLHRLNNPKIALDEKEFWKEDHILNDYIGQEDNFFSDEINAAVRQVEDFLKPYLKI